MSLPKWFAAMHLITQAKNSVCALELKRHLGVSYPTAWLMKHKIMETDTDWEGCYKLTTCDACHIASQAGPGTIPSQSR